MLAIAIVLAIAVLVRATPDWFGASVLTAVEGIAIGHLAGLWEVLSPRGHAIARGVYAGLSIVGVDVAATLLQHLH